MSFNSNIKVFDDSKILPIIYEVNFTIDLEIIESFEKWLQDYLNETINQKKSFRDAEVFQRFPKDEEEGDTEIKNPDRVHKYITVVFEVDNKESLDHYLSEEAPNVQKDLQDKFNSKNALVVSSRRVLYPIALWAKRIS
ncbi:12269_t:CDS:2 [Entrophospora sp. SA101]|nr:8399_t:CDS:2 [Entrophospora sp. SA101]CAJ0641641.1 12269_t:CDS:2 [Entrophospora sp. SA101]CAJ0826698.1 11174_t:CDS:2 [Entrophospora sp. SA101]CAJ0838438.1 10405_t:CDS:2 [Entrophospora sp. SA101]